MKRVLYLVVVAALLSACDSEPRYVINGTVNAKDSTMIYLQKRVDGTSVILDSAMIKGNAFKMKGVVEYPQMVSLIQKGMRGGKSFFIENAEITINGNIDSIYAASVTGSATQTEFETYLAMFNETNNQMESLDADARKAYSEGNIALGDSLSNELNNIDKKQVEMKKEYISTHPASYITPGIINDISYYLEVPDMESLLGSLDTTLNSVALVKGLRSRLELMRSVQIGQKAPDFTLNDVNGNPVSLSSKIGGKTKLLLVDFWASWCGYCRQENPNVVRVYNEFNKKGFDVFGVSLDSNGEKWKKAIADDKLTWTHVSDLQYWNSAAAKLYVVNGIPANFLLDENGVIIAHNIMGNDLYNKVKEILGGKK